MPKLGSLAASIHGSEVSEKLRDLFVDRHLEDVTYDEMSDSVTFVLRGTGVKGKSGNKQVIFSADGDESARLVIAAVSTLEEAVLG